MKNPHAQALGRLGGKAGRGASKARSKEHYQQIGRLSAQAKADARSALTRLVMHPMTAEARVQHWTFKPHDFLVR